MARIQSKNGPVSSLPISLLQERVKASRQGEDPARREEVETRARDARVKEWREERAIRRQAEALASRAVEEQAHRARSLEGQKGRFPNLPRLGVVEKGGLTFSPFGGLEVVKEGMGLEAWALKARVAFVEAKLQASFEEALRQVSPDQVQAAIKLGLDLSKPLSEDLLEDLHEALEAAVELA